MGQKVNPHGARVGVIFNWSTRWYAGKKDFANNLIEDFKLRKLLKEKYYSTGISHIDIERSANRITINVFTAKPGMIIGRGGAGIEALKKELGRLQTGVQTWCEANRAELTKDGKTKTANLTTGEVRWRKRPPSVTIKGVDVVLETLQRLGLTRFIRVKNEPNKEAMLAEPEAVRGIAGISIVTGQEDFIVTPLEVTAEEV